jgi:hypothetical protein
LVIGAVSTSRIALTPLADPILDRDAIPLT